MSELLDIQGDWTLTHTWEDGSTFTLDLPWPNKATELAYAKHCRNLVLAGINESRNVLDAMAYKEAMEAWSRLKVSGAYGWKRAAFWESLDDPDNQRELMWLWVAQGQRGKDDKDKLSREKFDAMWTEREEADDSLWKLLEDMLTKKKPGKITANTAAPETHQTS